MIVVRPIVKENVVYIIDTADSILIQENFVIIPTTHMSKGRFLAEGSLILVASLLVP